MPAPHDNAYKHLFSHPQAVRDLLRGFVHEDWVAMLDYDSLEKVNGSSVSDDPRSRQDEPSPASLAAYRPRLRYFLLDERRLSEASLDAPDNAVASVVRIGHSGSDQDLADRVGKLARKRQATENRELWRAVTVWIRRLVLPRFAPESERAAIEQRDDLPEVQHMISERIDSWKEQLQQQGRQQGQADALLRLLARRFGALPAGTEAQAHGASETQIEQWFDHIIDATSIAEAFGEH